MPGISAREREARKTVVSHHVHTERALDEALARCPACRVSGPKGRLVEHLERDHGYEGWAAARVARMLEEQR